MAHKDSENPVKTEEKMCQVNPYNWSLPEPESLMEALIHEYDKFSNPKPDLTEYTERQYPVSLCEQWLRFRMSTIKYYLDLISFVRSTIVNKTMDQEKIILGTSYKPTRDFELACETFQKDAKAEGWNFEWRIIRQNWFRFDVYCKLTANNITFNPNLPRFNVFRIPDSFGLKEDRNMHDLWKSFVSNYKLELAAESMNDEETNSFYNCYISLCECTYMHHGLRIKEGMIYSGFDPTTDRSFNTAFDIFKVEAEVRGWNVQVDRVGRETRLSVVKNND